MTAGATSGATGATNGAATPIAEVMPLMQALNETTHMTDAKAFIAWLDQQPSVAKNRKIGTQGYCMGGPIAFRTAAAVPDRVGAVGSFHGGGLVTPAPDSPHLQASKSKAQFLIAIATNDDQRAPTDKEFCSRSKRAFDWALSSQVTTVEQVPPPFDLGAEMNVYPCPTP